MGCYQQKKKIEKMDKIGEKKWTSFWTYFFQLSFFIIYSNSSIIFHDLNKYFVMNYHKDARACANCYHFYHKITIFARQIVHYDKCC